MNNDCKVLSTVPGTGYRLNHTSCCHVHKFSLGISQAPTFLFIHMLRSFVRKAERQTFKSLQDLPCLEDHQRYSCLPQVVCTSAARQLEPSSDWSVIITQPLSWEMRAREANSVTNPNHSPQRSPAGSQPPTSGPRPEVSL